MPRIQKPLSEVHFKRELEALAHTDKRPGPEGWLLSPRGVADFIIGLKEPVKHPDGELVQVNRKFYGDDALVERSVITLTTLRGLMLVGEPGTAKSMLSELLSAAISGDSTLTVQGSAGTTEDQVRYGWNYAILLARGPIREALVPAPLFQGMSSGKVVRFEEITRCLPEVQDVLLAPLSERLLVIPELSGADRLLQARPGFCVIATANTRDRGVNEMSAALKRRFNFETIHPISDPAVEMALVRQKTNLALAETQVNTRITPDVTKLLVTIFHELREGRTIDGERLDKPSTPMSTAEAVSVAISSGMQAFHYGSGEIVADDVVKHLVGAVLKDDIDDLKRLKGYFNRVIRRRARDNQAWEAWYQARKWLR